MQKLHALHPELTMIATAHHAETVAEAYKEHLIINNTPCELKDFADCDYIFLCTPTKRNIEYLRVERCNFSGLHHHGCRQCQDGDPQRSDKTRP